MPRETYLTNNKCTVLNKHNTGGKTEISYTCHYLYLVPKVKYYFFYIFHVSLSKSSENDTRKMYMNIFCI